VKRTVNNVAITITKRKEDAAISQVELIFTSILEKKSGETKGFTWIIMPS
jgi:hypothetical protein